MIRKVMSDEFYKVAAKLSQSINADCAVVLIGSAARACRTENSDIDILFVCSVRVPAIPVISGYHIKFSTEADFLRRLNAGEDFEDSKLGASDMVCSFWIVERGNASNPLRPMFGPAGI